MFNMMALLLLTGMRLSDAVLLKPDNIDADMGNYVLIIREGKSPSAVRRVPVAPCLRQGIGAAIAGLRGKSNYWTNAFILYRRKMGLTDERTVLHSLRHSFSTFADSDEKLQRHHIQSVIGHSKGSVTDIYTRVSDNQRQRVVAAVEAALPRELVALIVKRFGEN